MKIVNLSGPAVIAGAVRYPIEGALTVTDEQAEQLEKSGRLDGEPEDLPVEDEQQETSAKPKRGATNKES